MTASLFIIAVSVFSNFGVWFFGFRAKFLRLFGFYYQGYIVNLSFIDTSRVFFHNNIEIGVSLRVLHCVADLRLKKFLICS